jgi:hypothetical protein
MARDGVVEYDKTLRSQSISSVGIEEDLQELIRAQKRRDSRPPEMTSYPSLAVDLPSGFMGSCTGVVSAKPRKQQDISLPKDVDPKDNALGISMSGSSPQFRPPTSIKESSAESIVIGYVSPHRPLEQESPSDYSQVSRTESYYGSPSLTQGKSPPQITPAGDYYALYDASSQIKHRSYNARRTSLYSTASHVMSGQSKNSYEAEGHSRTQHQSEYQRHLPGGGNNQHYHLSPIDISRLDEGTQPLHLGRADGRPCPYQLHPSSPDEDEDSHGDSFHIHASQHQRH